MGFLIIARLEQNTEYRCKSVSLFLLGSLTVIFISEQNSCKSQCQRISCRELPPLSCIKCFRVSGARLVWGRHGVSFKGRIVFIFFIILLVVLSFMVEIVFLSEDCSLFTSLSSSLFCPVPHFYFLFWKFFVYFSTLNFRIPLNQTLPSGWWFLKCHDLFKLRPSHTPRNKIFPAYLIWRLFFFYFFF